MTVPNDGHPQWCARDVCTAGQDAGAHRTHRSVVPADDDDFGDPFLTWIEQPTTGEWDPIVVINPAAHLLDVRQQQILSIRQAVHFRHLLGSFVAKVRGQ